MSPEGAPVGRRDHLRPWAGVRSWDSEEKESAPVSLPPALTAALSLLPLGIFQLARPVFPSSDVFLEKQKRRSRGLVLTGTQVQEHIMNFYKIQLFMNFLSLP